MRFTKYLLLLIILITGCSTYYGGDRYRVDPPRTGPELIEHNGVRIPLFFGYGEGSTMREAERDAEADAMLRAALVMLGERASLYAGEADRIIDRLQHLDPYLAAGSRKVTAWEFESGEYQVIVGVRVNLDGLAGLLYLAGIQGGMISDYPSRLLLPDEIPPDIGTYDHLRDVLTPPRQEGKGCRQSDRYEPVCLTVRK